MRFLCCFCCLKWGKSPSPVTCCERNLCFVVSLDLIFGGRENGVCPGSDKIHLPELSNRISFFWLTGFAVKIIVLRNLGNHHFLGFLFCQHGLFSDCLQRILYVDLIVNLLLRITSMMSLQIHGHVIRTELQPKVLALQSCLWKQEVTPKSLEKCRLNVKVCKPKLVTCWKHVLSTAGIHLQFCLVQCVGIRILPNFVFEPLSM